jgi:protein SCO1/2
MRFAHKVRRSDIAGRGWPQIRALMIAYNVEKSVLLMHMMNFRQSLVFLLLLIVSVSLNATASDEMDLKAEFDLVGHDGEAVTHLDFRGRYVLLAFGFTNCPHVCPTMAANMAGALKMAENDAAGVFISVDTERDTPEIVHQYASSFEDKMIGLGGSHEQINAAADNFNVTYVVSKSQKSYTVQHTSNIFVIDPEGQVVETFPLNARPSELLAVIDSVD